MPVFFVASECIGNGTVTIQGALLDHLKNSLRTQVAEELWVTDGQRRYRIRVEHLDRCYLQGRILAEQIRPRRANPSLLLGQAVLKGERMDWVVQKATELGAAAIVPLISARVIARPRAERLGSQQERWQRIAFEASQQAERWDVPAVKSSTRVSDFFTDSSPSLFRIIFSERGDGLSLNSLDLPTSPDMSIVLAVGPEGGWEREELAQALDTRFTPVTLGGRILRAETAAIAAISIVQSRLGELG